MTVNIQTSPSLISNAYGAALARNGSAAISVDDADERDRLVYTSAHPHDLSPGGVARRRRRFERMNPHRGISL